MEKDECDRKKYKKFKITTSQGNFEINYPNDQRPGFCPYCHKPIPVIEIIFKKADE